MSDDETQAHDPDETIGHADMPTAGPPVGPSVEVPEAIAGYRILRKLGEGGMGVVFEAEQQSPRRNVALKVVRGGSFVNETTVKMFQREAESLARLKHPNIAGIYESGCTDNGMHYFAMELVAGKELGQEMLAWPRTIGPEDLKYRLRLFRQIADAVNYAHQRGVIHRDLKPGNVIVSEPTTDADRSLSVAGLPVVKILDFGLARITEGDIAAATMQTEVGMIKGTLPYMSPEQARGIPEDIDLRTDVYALGVMLYQMLSLDFPYDTQKTSLIEAVRVICEDPIQPLRKVWKGTRKLDEDLETISAKALEKDVTQRYDSAAALSEDIGRYLENQPILARPPSTVYQLKKLVARNKVATATLAAIAVGLVAFGVSMGVLWRKSEIARARAEASKLVALGQLQLDSFSTATLAYATKSIEVADTAEARRLAVQALWKGPPVWRLDLQTGLMTAFHPDGKSLLQSRWTPPADSIFRLVRSDGTSEPYERIYEGRNAQVQWTTGPDRFLTQDPFAAEGWDVALWSVSESRVLGRGSYPGWIEGAWNSEHDSLVAFTRGGQLSSERLIDGESRKILGVFPGAPRTARLSGDGAWVGTVDADGNVAVVAVLEDGLSRPRRLGAHRGAIQAAIASESRLLLTRDAAGEVRIWDARGDAAVRVTSGPPGPGELQAAANGRLLQLLLPAEEGAEVWVASLLDDPPTWRNTGTHSISNSPVLDPAGMQVGFPVSPGTNHWMALRSPDGTVPIELQNGFVGQRDYMTFDPTGRWMAQSSGGLSLWYMARPYPMAIKHAAGWTVAFDPGGEWFAVRSGSESRATVAAWPLEGELPGPRRTLVELAPGSSTTTLAISPDAKTLVVGERGPESGTGPMLADVQTGETRYLADGFADQVVGTAFSLDGSLVAATGGQFVPAESVIKVWNRSNGELIATHDPEEKHSHNSVGFDSKGRVIWANGEGLWAWDLESGEQARVYEGHAVDFTMSADRRLVLLRVGPTPIRRLVLVEIDTEVSRDLTAYGESVRRAAIDPGGRWVGMADQGGTVRVGNVDGSEPHLMLSHDGAVSTVAFDPKGRWFVSGGRDEIRFWPLPDIDSTPLHVLPHDELVAKLRSLTNVRLVEDSESGAGWKIKFGPFPGWEHDPVW